MKRRVSSFQADRLLLTTAEVMDLLRVSRSTLYRGVRKGIYPQPLLMGHRAIRWRSHAIQDLVERGVK
ncbi:helix-turn-helix transcriptional regulator [Rhodoferax sp.]|uniref:helix-turn-helix transcriptional regulator n=1 Tax=Rhodoferax sp. TaxID=50421 RepID=UPI003783A608